MELQRQEQDKLLSCVILAFLFSREISMVFTNLKADDQPKHCFSCQGQASCIWRFCESLFPDCFNYMDKLLENLKDEMQGKCCSCEPALCVLK